VHLIAQTIIHQVKQGVSIRAFKHAVPTVNALRDLSVATSLTMELGPVLTAHLLIIHPIVVYTVTLEKITVCQHASIPALTHHLARQILIAIMWMAIPVCV